MEVVINDSILDEPDWLGHEFPKWQARIDLKLLQARGEVTSERKLAERWQWCKAKVHRLMCEPQVNHLRTKTNTENQAVSAISEPQVNRKRTTLDERKDIPLNNIIINPIEKKEEDIKDKEKYSLENKKKTTRFVPPTIEEVRAYIQEKGYDVDAEKWWHFYNAKNWMVGKNKMSRWRSAVTTWNKGNGASRTLNYNEQKQADLIRAIQSI